jgi:hypothetical protein
MISKRTYKILKHINKLGDNAEYYEIVNKFSIKNKVFDTAEFCDYSNKGYFEKQSLDSTTIRLTPSAYAEMEAYKDDKTSRIRLPIIAIVISILSFGAAIWALFKK